MTLSEASLSHLNRADGSATYSQNEYTVIGAVNGPIQVARQDELPEEATIDVIIRPAVGVGGTKERHLESILHSTLQHIILTQNHPRTLIQITLQIVNMPDNDTSASKPYSSTLPVLPSLLQTSLLALLSASIPLSTTYSSLLISVPADDGEPTIDPPFKMLADARSTHVFAFSAAGELLLAQSEGDFDMDVWDHVFDMGLARARAEEEDELEDEGEDTAMADNPAEEGKGGFVRKVMREKFQRDQKWKEDRG